MVGFLRFAGEPDSVSERGYRENEERRLLRGGGKEAPLCEIEVEHKEGDEETTRRFADTVASTYGLTALTASKFARANALAKSL